MSVNVMDYGAVGDGVTDDTLAFKDALDYLLNTLGEGVLFCPQGKYLISDKLEITKPFVGIKGEGIDATTLIFDGCSGLKLTEWTGSFYGFSLAAIEDLKLEGLGSLASQGYVRIGIEMDNSNMYFFNRFWIHNFDIGINATTSILSRIENFSISGCKIGMRFTSSSYDNIITNGNINACSEAGIVEIASEIYISNMDIEAIGVYSSGRYRGGSAIITGYGTTVRDCHIESSGNGIGLNSDGYVMIENSAVAGCVHGVYQIAGGIINGNYNFKNVNFANTEEAEFYIPATSQYQIEDCLAFNNLGLPIGLDINASQYYGVIKGLQYSDAGRLVSYRCPGIVVNGRYVWTGFENLTENVVFGTIGANSTQEFTITLTTEKPVNAHSSVAPVIVDYAVAPGLICTAYAVPSTTDTVKVQLTNTTTSSIAVGTKDLVLKIM